MASVLTDTRSSQEAAPHGDPAAGALNAASASKFAGGPALIHMGSL